jgi:hypothetical protein
MLGVCHGTKVSPFWGCLAVTQASEGSVRSHWSDLPQRCSLLSDGRILGQTQDKEGKLAFGHLILPLAPFSLFWLPLSLPYAIFYRIRS